MKKHTEFTFNLPVLRIIENEHHLLRHLMEEWHPIVLGFERDIYTVGEAREAIQTLRKEITEFTVPLKKHLKKEEEYLFPLLSLYIGTEQGPVLATEEEHAEIDAYIEHFLHHSEGSMNDFSLQELKSIVQDISEVFEIITFHFIKEESVIFPMVEEILSSNEQYALFENMYSSII